MNDSSHYLHEFNEEELYEILRKPDEWSNYDHAYSQKLLKSRGHEIDLEKIKSFTEKRYEELSKPEKSSQLQIVAGYIFACIGGLLGIMIGWYIWKSTKTLSDGKKTFVYEQEDRQHAKTIAILGTTMTSILIIIRIVIFFQV